MKYIGVIVLFILYPVYLLFPTNVVNVYPIERMQTTEIYVKEGDTLKFEVSGQWTLWDKYKPVRFLLNHQWLMAFRVGLL